MRTILTSLRHGIKESAQLRVCCIFKSLCVFILFTPERIPLSLLKEQTLLWLFPLLLFDRSPSPKPPLYAGGGCSDSGGLLGQEPAACSLCCLAVPYTPNLCHSPAELSFPICQVNGMAVLLLLFSYFVHGLSVYSWDHF